MNNQPIKICILGGGFGGLYTALYLSQWAKVKSGHCQIQLVEPRERFTFTPLLYELLTDELQSWEIGPTYQKLLRQTPIQHHQQRAIALDLPSRQVQLANQQCLGYDYLVLAVGTQTFWANVPGAQTHALSFRSIDEGEILRERLRLLKASSPEPLRLAVIGAGPNGVELACKVADYFGAQGQVHLIDRSEGILKNFPRSVQAAAYRALKARRIQLGLNTLVRAIHAEEIHLATHHQRQVLPVNLVIWAAGAQMRPWVRQLDCPQTSQGKLHIRPTLQLFDYPEVFALGDLAEIQPLKQRIPATAQAAYQQANCTAKNLKAAIQQQPLKSFFYFHLGDMLALGMGSAVVTSFFLKFEGHLGAVIRRLAYIIRLPTKRHRWQVLRNLFWNWSIGRFSTRHSPSMTPSSPTSQELVN